MFKREFLYKVFIVWLPFAVLATLTSFAIYAANQQSARSAANDPQIQIAEDLATRIEDGKFTPNDANNSSETINLTKSIGTYVIVYNNDQNPIYSTATLNDKTPAPPTGVFEAAKINKENRITWQPQAGVRSAIVVVKYEGANPGYVLVGRSLKEVELRTSNLGMLILLGWLFTLAVLLVTVGVVLKLYKKIADQPAL